MNAKCLFIFISLAGLCLASKRLGNPNDDEVHFWEVMEPAVSIYDRKDAVDQETYLPYRRFSVQGRKEHIIDIAFAHLKEGTSMKFFFAKKHPVEKVVPVYQPAEMEIQAAVLPEFIRRMATAEEDSNYLFLNTIQDVRNELSTIGDKKRLIFQENSPEEQRQSRQVRIQLKFVENLLGIFVITPTKAGEEHILRVEYNIAKSQKSYQGVIEIPVLTNQKTALRLKLQDVTNILRLKDHVNCNKDNLDVLNTFVTSSFPKLITFIPEADSTDILKKFTLKSGDDRATGQLIYLPPKPDSTEIGRFKIEIAMNGRVEISEEFDRMSIPDYRAFLESLNIGRLFQTLWEKIQIIFRQEMSAGYPSETNIVEFSKPHTDTPFLGIGNTEHSLQATVNKRPFTTLFFVEGSKQFQTRFETAVPVLREISLTFPRKEFRKDAIQLFFHNFVGMMVVADKENWQGRISQIKLTV